jgi:hypothetical protein
MTRLRIRLLVGAVLPLALLGSGSYASTVTSQPIPEFEAREFSQRFFGRSSLGKPFGWTSKFDYAFKNSVLSFSIDIELQGDVAAANQVVRDNQTYLEIWEQGIEEIWNDAPRIVDGSYFYDFFFDVNFVSSSPHHTVNVLNGVGHTSMTNWYLDNSGIGWTDEWIDEIAAHEVGHMLGLYDEFATGALDPNLDQFALHTDVCEWTQPSPGTFMKVGSWCGGLMADLGPTQERYYRDLISLIGFGADRNLVFAPPHREYAGEPPGITPIPLGSSAMYLAFGLLGIPASRRVRRHVAG